MSHATSRPALDRALHALPDLASRRAVLRERLGAQAIDAIVRRALDGRTRERDATVALASVLVGMRRAGEIEALDALRTEADRAGLVAVAALLADGPAHRALAPRGRLREICIGVEAPLRRWSLERERNTHRVWLYLLRRHAVVEEFGMHPSPIFVARLLSVRWLDVGDALIVAARRPTSPGIAFELASNDRWIQRLEIREAMAQNPFTPTGIVLSLLPSIRHCLLPHLRDAGDAHPRVSEAAAALLALRAG